MERKKKKKYVSPTIDVEEAVNHINRYSLPYGLCKGEGINTEGMTPREAWEAWENKTGKTKEQAEKEHWGEDKGKEKNKEEDRGETGKERSRIKSIDELRKQIADFGNLVDKAKSLNIEYKEPRESAYTEDMQDNVISEIAGGDLTRGSCVSVALAYVMNKNGYYTTDYRGGISQAFFSQNWYGIKDTFGAKTFRDTNGKVAMDKALSTTEVGKEYLLCAGSHCSVIRKTEKGYEYLELQSSSENGFKPLNMKVLQQRFRYHRSRYTYGIKLEVSADIVSLEEMAKHKDELFYLSGYLNTDGKDQNKGGGGYAK